MPRRPWGETDVQLTTVSLGTRARGGPWQFGWGPQDEAEGMAAIVTALDQGINWIETAPGISGPVQS